MNVAMNPAQPIDTVLNHLKKLFRGDRGVVFAESEYGNYYAKLSCIPANLNGDASPTLRRILKDLGISDVTEIEGEGGMWWDFDFKGTRFTCDLLVKSCGGSELYPTSCTRSSEAERELLRELATEIVRLV